MNQKTADELLRNSTIDRKLAEDLLASLLGIDRQKLYCEKKEILVNKDKSSKFTSWQNKIKAGFPPQYVIGSAPFYGREFIVNKNVLIPRVETELLVEQAISYCVSRNAYCVPNKKNEIKIIDLGTGSGCIAVSLYCELIQNTKYKIRDTKFYATDISSYALRIARLNASSNNAKIMFYKSDLFPNDKLPKKFDLILANLPYLSKDYISENQLLKHEPEIALSGGEDGLDIIKKLIYKLPQKLSKGGLAILEIDPRQKEKLKKIVNRTSMRFKFTKDLANRTRFIKIYR